MSEDRGHLWVLVRYEIDRGAVLPWEHEETKVSTQEGDALDQFMEHIFTGIRDNTLEVVMSEDD
jgi:hypothetical protein